jgi:thiol-disulfide isomerase/thioredoxin
MNGMKCLTGSQSEENPGEITVFTAKWCGACKRRVPQILKKAQTAGLRVRLIDVDNAGLEDGKMLRRVKFVPHIDYMGREVEEEELDLLAKSEGG